MNLGLSTRVVRGGSAVQTVYWRMSRPSARVAPKLVKHGRIFVFQREPQAALPPANVADKLATHHLQL